MRFHVGIVTLEQGYCKRKLTLFVVDTFKKTV